MLVLGVCYLQPGSIARAIAAAPPTDHVLSTNDELVRFHQNNSMECPVKQISLSIRKGERITLNYLMK